MPTVPMLTLHRLADSWPNVRIAVLNTGKYGKLLNPPPPYDGDEDIPDDSQEVFPEPWTINDPTVPWHCQHPSATQAG